jgi:hypothetical protein
MDKKEALKQIKAGDFSLADADDKLKADKEVVLAAVKQASYTLQYADKKLKGNKEVVLAAVKQDGGELRFADKKLKANKEVVLAAVKKGGWSHQPLQYADKKLKGNKEVVLAAVKQNGRALQYADKKSKGDKEVVLAAVKQDGSALDYADKKLKGNKEVVLTFYWDARATYENADENTSMEISETHVGKTWQDCCDDCVADGDWDDNEVVTGESNVVETSRDLTKIIIRDNGDEKEAPQEVYDYYDKEQDRVSQPEYDHGIHNLFGQMKPWQKK